MAADNANDRRLYQRQTEVVRQRSEAIDKALGVLGRLKVRQDVAEQQIKTASVGFVTRGSVERERAEAHVEAFGYPARSRRDRARRRSDHSRALELVPCISNSQSKSRALLRAGFVAASRNI